MANLDETKKAIEALLAACDADDQDKWGVLRGLAEPLYPPTRTRCAASPSGHHEPDPRLAAPNNADPFYVAVHCAYCDVCGDVRIADDMIAWDDE